VHGEPVPRRRLGHPRHAAMHGCLISIILLSRLYYILHLAFHLALIALYSQEGREETSDTPYVGLASRSVIGRRYFVDPSVE
jgi:hypothetical protein